MLGQPNPWMLPGTNPSKRRFSANHINPRQLTAQGEEKKKKKDSDLPHATLL
jgi:hypothetical protein